jgi:CBS domain-containing protein
MIRIPLVRDVMWKNLPIVSGDQSLAGAAQVMLNTRSLGVVVNDVERRPAMVLTYRRLVKAIAMGANIKDQVVKHAVHPPITIRETDTIVEALNLMKEENIRFLPVTDNKGVLVGIIEPRHIAIKIWDLLPYGALRVEGALRKIVVLSGDLNLRIAAKAMDENNVPEVFVKTSSSELKVLREWDFLEAISKALPEEAKIQDYARGFMVKVPSGYDAKAAVELMNENNISRLLVVEEGRERIVTISDLAFEALKILDELALKTIGFVMVKSKPGREGELAADLLMIPEVKEVFTVAGEYDLLLKIETDSVRSLYKVVIEKIRSDPRVESTTTFVATEIAEKK